METGNEQLFQGNHFIMLLLQYPFNKGNALTYVVSCLLNNAIYFEYCWVTNKQYECHLLNQVVIILT
jgi:hypothetical protein